MVPERGEMEVEREDELSFRLEERKDHSRSVFSARRFRRNTDPGDREWNLMMAVSEEMSVGGKKRDSWCESGSLLKSRWGGIQLQPVSPSPKERPSKQVKAEAKRIWERGDVLYGASDRKGSSGEISRA